MAENNKLSLEPYKGVRDFYPEDEYVQKYLFATMRAVAERFGYAEYNASVLEPSELYRGKSSEEIVNEQTYTFTDRGDREVTLRPEMTPTVARMVAAKRRELGFPLRLFSIPNLFRYERPQRGRLREHWQFNVDLFGTSSRAADAEVIELAHQLLIAFGGTENDFVIKVGSRTFLDSLIAGKGLPAEDGKKLLGLLDRRAKMPAEEFESALAALGIAFESLSPEKPPEDVADVLAQLRELGIHNAVYDPSVVRGFTYYTGVVFEVFDLHPDNNRSMFGGGRYDNLLSLFGGERVPAVGMAAGDVTLRDFLAVRGLLPEYIPAANVYIALTDPQFSLQAMQLAGEMRAGGVSVATDFGERKLGDQIKTATKHGIPFLIVVGEDELRSGAFTVRDLSTGDERTLAREELANFFLSVS